MSLVHQNKSQKMRASLSFDASLLTNAASLIVQIIDCRASEFFNGWPEQGMTEGGAFTVCIQCSHSMARYNVASTTKAFSC